MCTEISDVETLAAEEAEVRYWEATAKNCINSLRLQQPYDMALYTTGIETLDHWLSLLPQD